MKKIISLILIAAALASFTACGKKGVSLSETFPYTGDSSFISTEYEPPEETEEVVGNNPKMLFDGEEIKLSHPLQYRDGVLYAYINDFASAFGAHTVYSGKETIFSSSDDTVLIFKRGLSFFTVVNIAYGTSYTLPLSAEIQVSSDSKVYVSAVDVANGFGYVAKYYSDSNTLVVTTPQVQQPVEEPATEQYTGEAYY